VAGRRVDVVSLDARGLAEGFADQLLTVVVVPMS
jgi:hypothetical protein